MEINKYYAMQGIKEYLQIKRAVDELQGNDFETIYKAITQRFYGNTANYDGTLFDICLSRVLCTIKKGKRKTATLDKYLMFDISDHLDGDWIDIYIYDLKKYAPPLQVCECCGKNVFLGDNGDYIEKEVFCYECQRGR